MSQVKVFCMCPYCLFPDEEYRQLERYLAKKVGIPHSPTFYCQNEEYYREIEQREEKESG